MHVQILKVRGNLPDLNTIIAASKKHWSSYSRLKRDATSLVCLSCKEQGIKPVKSADFDFFWFCESRRKDKDNISAGGRKMILDGLVDAGVIKDDGWSYVGDFQDIFSIDKDDPRVEVVIKDFTEELGE